MRENPKHKAIYVWDEMSKPEDPSPGGILATDVPVNAKNKNMVVPTNSPRKATRSINGPRLSHDLGFKKELTVTHGFSSACRLVSLSERGF